LKKVMLNQQMHFIQSYKGEERHYTIYIVSSNSIQMYWESIN